MIKVASGWTDYEILATGSGMKLERWGKFCLLRPDPQVIWPERLDLNSYEKLSAVYKRSSTGGGKWEYYKKIPENFSVERQDLKFSLKLMGFKHTGLFPEQAVNWDEMSGLIRGAGRKINVLNLFAYTGAATVACAKAGASVCHVDAAKAMVERAGINARLSGAPENSIRYIIDDCIKFVEREIRRGRCYDAVIMDPPSYGRGPSGELWKLEDNLYKLVRKTVDLISDKPLFYLINSYTTGLQPSVIGNILNLNLSAFKGESEVYEVALPTQEEGIILPCGCSGIYRFN
ncbi:MAG: class I SAM-dependent methyltransferase [Christensenellales bacterium]|jgi:23S rRNA (cytosine1962-C5)-methyltransferase